jgi:hypothetical protein
LLLVLCCSTFSAILIPASAESVRAGVRRSDGFGNIVGITWKTWTAAGHHLSKARKKIVRKM